MKRGSNEISEASNREQCNVTKIIKTIIGVTSSRELEKEERAGKKWRRKKYEKRWGEEEQKRKEEEEKKRMDNEWRRVKKIRTREERRVERE